MPALLAGGSIARGSLFSIRGARLGPASPVRAQNDAPQKELSGVSILIGAGPASVRALPLYVSDDHILAFLPADAPLGEKNITVSHGGQVSPPRTITVVQSSVGIFGRQVENAKELPDSLRMVKRPVSSPGKTVSMLVTGLGNATQDTLRILVGGKPVQKIISSQPEGTPGVNRIVFEIPPTAPLGCEVPVLAKAGASWSNTVSVRLETETQRCPDMDTWISKSFMARNRSGFVFLLRIAFQVGLKSLGYDNYVWDLATAGFSKVKDNQADGVFMLPPRGSCATYTGIVPLGGVLNPRTVPEIRSSVFNMTVPFALPDNPMLYGGPRIALEGPKGVKNIDHDPKRPDFYVADLGGSPPGVRVLESPPLYLDPGRYKVTGLGGGDIGRFSSEVTIPPELVWSNRGAVLEIQRAKGVTVRWSPKDKDRLITVIAAAVDGVTGATGLCLCVAPKGSSSFFIPPESLANLPVTSGVSQGGSPEAGLILGSLPDRPPEQFRADGLDSGILIPGMFTGKNVAFR